MQAQLTELSHRAIRYAQIEASERGAAFVEPEHLLLAILRDDHSGARIKLQEQGCPPGAVRDEITALLPTPGTERDRAQQITPENIRVSTRTEAVLRSAAEATARDQRRFIGPEHILTALVTEPTPLLARIWAEYNITEACLAADSTFEPPQAKQHERDHVAKTPVEMAPSWIHFTEAAKNAVLFAQIEASRSGFNRIPPIFLLSGVLQEEETVVADVLARCGVERNALREALIDLLPTGCGRDPKKNLSLDGKAKAVFHRATEMSMKLSDSHVGTEHLLLGLLNDKTEAGALLRANNLKEAALLDVILTAERSKRIVPASNLNPLTGKLMWGILAASIVGLLWLLFSSR
jgi:ATP-dependent Clp protease ATP-binding subunit ClpC